MGSRPGDYTGIWLWHGLSALPWAGEVLALVWRRMRIARVGLALSVRADAVGVRGPVHAAGPRTHGTARDSRGSTGVGVLLRAGIRGKTNRQRHPLRQDGDGRRPPHVIRSEPSFALRILPTNDRSSVRVVDRGPAKGPRAEGVLIDVSSGAAARSRLRSPGPHAGSPRSAALGTLTSAGPKGPPYGAPLVGNHNLLQRLDVGAELGAPCREAVLLRDERDDVGVGLGPEGCRADRRASACACARRDRRPTCRSTGTGSSLRSGSARCSCRAGRRRDTTRTTARTPSGRARPEPRCRHRPTPFASAPEP